MFFWFAIRFVTGAFVGWVIENAIWPARYSRALGGERLSVPLLPVYGFGTVAVLGLRRTLLSTVPWPLRWAAYAVALSGVELAACQADRLTGGLSWFYGGGQGKPDDATTSARSCVDGPHAAAWGALGLAAEAVLG